MKDWFDKQQIVCPCGHRWILISNREITTEQQDYWWRKFEVEYENKKIHKEKEG